MHMLVAHAQWPVIQRVLQAVQARMGEHWTECLLNIQDQDNAGVIDRALSSSPAVANKIKDTFGGIEQRTPQQAAEINAHNRSTKRERVWDKDGNGSGSAKGSSGSAKGQRLAYGDSGSAKGSGSAHGPAKGSAKGSGDDLWAPYNKAKWAPEPPWKCPSGTAPWHHSGWGSAHGYGTTDWSCRWAPTSSGFDWSNTAGSSWQCVHNLYRREIPEGEWVCDGSGNEQFRYYRW